MVKLTVETMREFKIKHGVRIKQPKSVGISGIYGIVKSGRAWMVQIFHEDQAHFFGRYTELDEAIDALIEGRKSLGVKDPYEGVPVGWGLV